MMPFQKACVWMEVWRASFGETSTGGVTHTMENTCQRNKDNMYFHCLGSSLSCVYESLMGQGICYGLRKLYQENYIIISHTCWVYNPMQLVCIRVRGACTYQHVSISMVLLNVFSHEVCNKLYPKMQKQSSCEMHHFGMRTMPLKSAACKAPRRWTTNIILQYTVIHKCYYVTCLMLSQTCRISEHIYIYIHTCMFNPCML
jgi:hypothetical protein